uniref:Uncharacterized protein n=1 Tax=Anguilla anguilla TaxID=7936 RepID=A0A0E9WQE1_ANGAN
MVEKKKQMTNTWISIVLRNQIVLYLSILRDLEYLRRLQCFNTVLTPFLPLKL